MIKFTPKKLSWPDIWDITEEFRSKHKFANEFPVKIEELIEFNLGIEIVPEPNLKLKIDVEAYLSKDLKKIYIDKKGFESNAYLARHRFTLAEEVGHYVLHRDIYEKGVKYESEDEFIQDIQNMDIDDLIWVERQAKQFAGRLLVPKDELVKRIERSSDLIDSAYEKYKGGEDLEEFIIEAFSKKFCGDFLVSYMVLEIRINNEKLNHYFRE